MQRIVSLESANQKRKTALLQLHNEKGLKRLKTFGLKYIVLFKYLRQRSVC